MKTKKSIENRLPWSFLGFILGTISLIIAIYFFYLSKMEAKSDIKFYVEDEFKLIELKEKFDDIKIFYKDEDIILSKKEIKIMCITMENEGRTILQSFFDQNMPFGLTFNKSSILSVDLMKPISDYLQTNLFKPKNTVEYNEGKLIFGKPIIEEGQKVSFKVYLLQEKGSFSTNVEVLGKISGLDNIPILRRVSDNESKPTSQMTKSELIGIAFAAGYFGIIAFALSMLPFILILEKRDKNKKLKLTSDFKQQRNDINEEREKIISLYFDNWKSYYSKVIKALLANNNVIDISNMIKDLIPKKNRYPFSFNFFDYFIYLGIRNITPLELPSEIFEIHDDKIKFNKENETFIKDFLLYVKEIEIEQVAPADARTSRG